MDQQDFNFPLKCPIDYSIYDDPEVATLWPAQMDNQLEPPFNDAVLGGPSSSPYPIRYPVAPSFGMSSIGGNVGGPRAPMELQMLRPESPDENPINVRRENQIVFIIQEPDKTGSLWTRTKLFWAATEEHPGIPLRQAKLALALEVHGARGGTAFASACHKCSTRVSSAPPSSLLFDFASKGGLVGITAGVARVAFRFRCMPFHHGTTGREYRSTATNWDAEQILTRCTFPNCFRTAHHLRRRKGISIAVLPDDSVVVDTSVDSEEGRDAPPKEHTSDGSSSGTSAGESQCSVSRQPEDTPMYDAFISYEESKSEWDGSDLRATTLNDNAVDEELPVLLHANPRRGSTSGGEEIYLIVKNLPSTTVLYARFGCNIAPTSHIADGVLACYLPPGSHPGVVDVTLCQAPSVHEKSYGKSLVSFEYECDSCRAVALLSTLLSGTLFTEVTPATQGFLQGSNQSSTIQCPDCTHSATMAPSSFPESAFIEVLAAFESLPDFAQRLSTVNLYRQSLLHLAVHLRYRDLVQRLVSWGSDLNIKDVNGFTALHTAYLCGDPSITRTLEQRGAIHLSLDILGRPPLELASGALKDHNTESHPNGHF